MIDTVRQIYRAAVPAPLRAGMRRLLPRSLFRAEEIYPDDYFGYLDLQQETSYQVMAQSIVARFRPRSVIDAGCGSGGLLLQLSRAGVSECRGIEYSYAGRARCRARGLTVRAGDLGRSCPIEPDFDLCLCLEVAEHLAPSCADRLVANLAAGPRLILFSAATPGQGGHEHLNEQPYQYWIEKFSRQGCLLDAQSTASLRDEWAAQSVVPWFACNVMVFRRT